MKFMDDSIVKGNIVNDRLVAEGEQVLYKTYNRFPVAFDHAKGVELYDAGGHAFLDFGAGIAVAGLGYGNALVDQAMKEQIDKGLLHTSNLFYTGRPSRRRRSCSRRAGWIVCSSRTPAPRRSRAH